MSNKIKNEFPIGISNDENRTFMLFVNKINFLEEITEATPQAIKKMLDISEASATTTTLWGCALPLPNTMNDTQTHNWSSETSGLHTLAQSGITAASGSRIGKITEGKGDNVKTRTGIIDSKKTFDIGKVVREVAYRVGTRQPTVNPLYWQSYEGSAPREFNFAWDLIPRSEEEGYEMIEILRKLKQYSSPKLALGGTTLLSPYTFDMEISNGPINAVMKLSNMVIKSMDINYVADGGTQFHHNGVPKHITITMSVAELRTVVADDYDGTGVGWLHSGKGSASLAGGVVSAVGSGTKSAFNFTKEKVGSFFTN